MWSRVLSIDCLGIGKDDMMKSIIIRGCLVAFLKFSFFFPKLYLTLFKFFIRFLLIPFQS